MTNYETPTREWWVLRWLELLDSYRFKKRLERARNYAREGNVLSIEFKGAKVLAQVQGSDPEPYQVSLSLEPFRKEDWDYVIELMSQKAKFSAHLLAGEMPEDIEEVFTKSGLSLFPFTLADIRSRCSCPDQANPCKHIGAVYYQLGDRFSEDPFVLLQLRGKTKPEILKKLRQLRTRKAGKSAAKSAKKAKRRGKNKKKQAQTELSIDQFWIYDQPLDSSLVVIAPPPETQTPLEILGNIPLAGSDALALRQYIEQVYQNASQQAIVTALNRQ